MKRDWTVGTTLVALSFALSASGAIWLAWTVDPVLTYLAGIWAGLTGLCVLAATRNLRARLEATQQVVDAWNSSEARDELAQSPPAGTKAVYDQDAPSEVTHQCPPGSAGLTPCCGRNPMELPFSDRITVDPQRVTCGRAAAETAHVGAGPGDVGHLTVAPGATGWLGPDEVTFHRPPESFAERVQAITDYHLPEVAAQPMMAQVCPGTDQERVSAPGGYDPTGPDGMCPVCERVVPLDDGICEAHPWPYSFPPPAVEMTVAETDRLIANLQALPGTDDLGQVCVECGKPAGGAVAEAYLDPDGSSMTEMTWLCDDDYARAMAEGTDSE